MPRSPKRWTTCSSAGRPSRASSTTEGSASPTTPPNERCAGSPSAESHGCSVGSDRGGQRAAAMYTLIGTAKLNDIDPQAWLADVLERIAEPPGPAPAGAAALELAAASRSRHQQLADRHHPQRTRASSTAPAAFSGWLRNVFSMTRSASRGPGWRVRLAAKTSSAAVGVRFRQARRRQGSSAAAGRRCRRASASSVADPLWRRHRDGAHQYLADTRGRQPLGGADGTQAHALLTQGSDPLGSVRVPDRAAEPLALGTCVGEPSPRLAPRSRRVRTRQRSR